MKISVVGTKATDHDAPLLALILAEGTDSLDGAAGRVDAMLNGQITALRERRDFRGRSGDALLLFPSAGTPGAERVLLVGVGRAEELTTEKLRRAAATAARHTGRLELDRFSLAFPDTATLPGSVPVAAAARAIAEGATLGSYIFDEWKSKKSDDQEPQRSRVTGMTIVEVEDGRLRAAEEGARIGSIVARGENLARTLGNLPGNVATPAYLAGEAARIGRDHGLRVTALGPAELEAEGLGALLAVARGSDVEPRLIVLEHRGGREGDKPLVLLGKGLTFDAGGISIKPAQGMEEMKFDMCGGAAVLGAMQAIGELGVKANVVGVVPSSENLLSGSAMKPGDILRSHLGTTIEVVNTDAEGRLILADALSFLRRFEPAAVVDAATLTGACVIALGHHASAILGNDDALVAEVQAAGDRVGQVVWPLPMLDEYREQIRSDYADIKNSGGRPAGTITAAWFLREFVGDFPWAHLDIAGTAYSDGKIAYHTKGATGAPTRLFVEWVLSRAP